jgi:hypothetical protein
MIVNNSTKHFVARLVSSSTKYFVARQQCKGNPLVHFRGNAEHFCIVVSYIFATYTKKEGVLALPWQQ